MSIFNLILPTWLEPTPPPVVEHTISKYPASYTTSGSIQGTRYQNAIGKGADTAAVSGNDYSKSSSSTASINYAFDFSEIPDTATIKSMTLQAKGHCESTSQSSEKAELQVYSGNTAKSAAISFTSTSAQTLTIDFTGYTFTVAELKAAVLRFTIGYYGGLVNGATWTVTYEA